MTSNIKGAPTAFTPALVKDFVRWLDGPAAPIVGSDLSNKRDSHVVVTMDGGRIVSVEERHG